MRKALALSPLSSSPAPSPAPSILSAFHALTHHSLCLPMKVVPVPFTNPRSTLQSRRFPTTATGCAPGSPRETVSSCSSFAERDISYGRVLSLPQIGVRDGANFVFGEMPQTFVTATRAPHDGTVCEGVLVTETAMSPPLRRLLLSDALYINGLSLKALPYAQRASALRKEVVDRVHERKQQDSERVQRSPFKSVGLRAFWPATQLEKVKRSLIPSLTHGCKGAVVLDGKAPYSYGDQPSRCWEWSG